MYEFHLHFFLMNGMLENYSIARWLHWAIHYFITSLPSFAKKQWVLHRAHYVATLLLEECEDDTHIPEMGTWESTGTPKTLEFDCRGQNILHWGVPYIIGKLSKCRCRKWVCMSHLDIWNTSYGKKKGRESNWQFDSQPLKVGNRPDPDVCKWCAIDHWKALNERYKFALDLILIGGLSKEL